LKLLEVNEITLLQLYFENLVQKDLQRNQHHFSYNKFMCSLQMV